MNHTPLYMDYNASAPLLPAVQQAIMAVWDQVGNPSSVHGYGQAVGRLLQKARMHILTCLQGAKHHHLVFTSGGTEANALVLNQPHYDKVAALGTDHASVVESTPNLYQVKVHTQGQGDLTTLPTLGSGEKGLFSFSWANSETGVLQDAHTLTQEARRKGYDIHIDAVQILGKHPLTLQEVPADFMTLSAHKIGGPMGIGALIFDTRKDLHPFMKGGGQESFKRAGTPNVMGAVGFAKALECLDVQAFEKIRPLRRALENALQKSGGFLNGDRAQCLANTINVSMPGVPSQNQVMAFDMQGVALSAGSACSSGKITASPVLKAMGLEDALVNSAIRISLGPKTTQEDIARVAQIWDQLAHRTLSKTPMTFERT